MQRLTRFRQVLVMAGVASLMLATSVSAGASSTSGKYNAADAKLVPSAYKGTTLQVATDATYAPDESMNGSTMVGFDVDLMYAIAKTLGIKVKENNVTFDNIIVGIDDGKYRSATRLSPTRRVARSRSTSSTTSRPARASTRRASTTATFTGLKSFCGFTVAVETGTTEQSDADERRPRPARPARS